MSSIDFQNGLVVGLSIGNHKLSPEPSMGDRLIQKISPLQYVLEPEPIFSISGTNVIDPSLFLTISALTVVS